MKKDSRGYFRESGTYRGHPYDFRSKSKTALRQKIQDFMDSVDSGVVSSDMRVSDWADRWLETYKVPSVSAKQVETYRSIIKHYINPAVGSRKLQDVRPIELQSVLNGLTCSRNYGSKIKQTIQQIFRTARQNKLIADDPAEFLTLPKLASSSRRSITEQERSLILRACEDHRAGNWVLLMLFCGLRPAEAAALQWVDVDIPGRVVHVTKALDRYSGTIKSTKTAAGLRDIPIPEELAQRLRPGDPFDFVTVNSVGGIHNADSLLWLWRSFRRRMEELAGAKFYRNQVVISAVADDLTPYCLRHTYCTDLQAAGVPINVARELMGHTDISVTSAIYTHHSDASVSDALQKINAMQGHGTNPGTSQSGTA